MWSCALINPGDTTPRGQVISVAPAAIGAQSQATQVIWPAALTSTCPPRRPSPGFKTFPVISLSAPPGVTVQVPLGGGGRSALEQKVMTGPPPSAFPPASGIAPSG